MDRVEDPFLSFARSKRLPTAKFLPVWPIFKSRILNLRWKPPFWALIVTFAIVKGFSLMMASRWTISCWLNLTRLASGFSSNCMLTNIFGSEAKENMMSEIWVSQKFSPESADIRSDFQVLNFFFRTVVPVSSAKVKPTIKSEANIDFALTAHWDTFQIFANFLQFYITDLELVLFLSTPSNSTDV